MAEVRYQRTGSIGEITLDDPDHRNAMTPSLLDAFDGAIDAVAEDEPLAVIITGTGPCFSAGADLRGVLQRREDADRKPHERSFAMYAPFLRVLDIEVPVIAALNGHAVGGGFGLALLCDIRIAADDAKLGANFARLGLHPGLGIAYMLPRIVGLARASELLFTGELIRGREAAAIGLVNHAVPGEQVLPRARALADSIAAAAPYAVRMTKRTLRRFHGGEVRAAAWEEAYAQAASLETDDAREGMAALLDKRPPRFTGR
jgi:enoyl-CoA hydratase/carnithine racemase